VRRLATLGITAPVGHAAAATASAKEPLEEAAIAVCGPSGCAPFTDDGARRRLNRLLSAVDGSAPPIGWVVPGGEAIRTPRFTGSGTSARSYPPALAALIGREAEPAPAVLVTIAVGLRRANGRRGAQPA
jgi:hypothetical protein